MKTSCFIKNCRSNLPSIRLFKFPNKNTKLLGKWLETIPRDLYVSYSDSVFICEQHFEDRFIVKGTGPPKLSSNAIPTIFIEAKEIEEFDHSNCRFCLKKLQDDEKQLGINLFIRKQFFLITQTELNSSSNYSENICETCFNLTCDFVAYKKKLMDSQQKLEEAFKSCREESYGEPMFEDEVDLSLLQETESVLVKVEGENKSCVYIDSNFDNDDFFESSSSSESNFYDNVKVKKKAPESASPQLKLHEGSLQSMCEICGKYFSSSTSYQRHYDRIHLNVKNFECDVCGYQVYKKIELIRHLASHFKIRSHFCHLCPAAFMTRKALRKHGNCHNNQRNFVCDIDDCKAAFKSNDTLKLHKSEIHLKICRFPCPECGKSFYRKSKMVRHMQTHLTNLTQCPKCKKMFKNLKSMKNHLKTIHEEKKEFKCKYCTNCYSKNANLNRHILTVHIKQQIPCQVEGCNKVFSRHERYKDHIKALHKVLGEKRVSQLVEEAKNIKATCEFPEFQLS